jgi:predicted MFS family arabinose efflux permease
MECVLLKGNLWRDGDFIKFWGADTVTQFTGQISGLALPTVAVLTLNVSSLQLGILNALGFIAFPMLGLFVGVWMDRSSRKSVMIASNAVQVVALASVPAAFVFGGLQLYQLYAVSLIMGITTVFYDVAYQSYLPSLVRREDIVESNQKLEMSASAANVVGPSVASGLMQLLGAALSVSADALGTLIGALALVSIKRKEPKPEVRSDSRDSHFFREMKEGIKMITGNSLLWTQAGCTATWNLGSYVFSIAFLLFAYRNLGISKGVIGIVFSIGAVGFLFGVLISSSLTSKIGLGKAIALAPASNFGLLISLLAHGSLAPIILGVSIFIAYLGGASYNINQVSLRQIITPNRLQGRMNATMRTIVWGTIPAGSLLGGFFSASMGIMPTLVLGALVSGGSFLWILLGPIFKLNKQPMSAGE